MLAALLINPGSGVLFAPPAPSPWFIEHIVLEPVDLPAQVSIDLVKYNRNALPKEYVVFKNNSVVPLYIAGKPYDGTSDFDPISVQFPTGIGPLYKVVNGQAFKWIVKYNHPGSGFYFSWFKENERKDSIWLYVLENKIRSDLGTILTLDPRNQYDGYMPGDVKIPEPQKVALSIIYGAAEIQIPLTVFYTLNQDYRSYSNYLPDSIGPQTIICFVFVSFLLFMTIALFVLKKFRGWPGKNI